MIGVGRACADSEGDRIAPAFATPQGNWLATSDRRLTAVFRRLNDRAWSQRWKRDVPAPFPARPDHQSTAKSGAGAPNDRRVVNHGEPFTSKEVLDILNGTNESGIFD